MVLTSLAVVILQVRFIYTQNAHMHACCQQGRVKHTAERGGAPDRSLKICLEVTADCDLLVQHCFQYITNTSLYLVQLAVSSCTEYSCLLYLFLLIWSRKASGR